MWSISEVKREGWEKLKNYYWAALAVTFITVLFIRGGSGFSIAMNGHDEAATGLISSGEWFSSFPLSFINGWFGDIHPDYLIYCIFLRFFLGNPLEVGQCRFFMESRGQKSSAGVGKLFLVFKGNYYWNVVKIMFFRDLYTLLWTLLLFIPGFIKSYEYMMIPYILSENPEADKRDVFALTKEMTGDNKFDLFLLELSFIGWIILGALACGLGIFFVSPYVESAFAEVYASVRKEIGNFPFNGFGRQEEPDIYS